MSIFNSCVPIGGGGVNGALLESTLNNCNKIESLEEGVFKYTPAMIPILTKETDQGSKYIVEFDMIRKLSNSINKSAYESFEAICESNQISEADTYVFVSESTMNTIFESYSNDIETGTLMSINNAIKELQESGVNLLKDESLLQEGTKKFFKFEKLTTENPELEPIKNDLIKLNQFRTADSGAIYEDKDTVFKVILKILRFWSALYANITLIMGPFTYFIGWIDTLIDKIIVGAIDKQQTKMVKTDINKVIAELERLKGNTKDEKAKQKIQDSIDDLNEKLKKLDAE